MTHDRSSSLWVALVVATTLVTSCGENSPLTTTPTPVITNPVEPVVYAYPPTGVGAAMWAVRFYSDNRLYRPAVGFVFRLDVSGLPAASQVSNALLIANSTMEGLTSYTTEGTANVIISVTGGPIQCGSVLVEVGACTWPTVDPTTGEVVGGVIKFTHENALLYNLGTIVKEILRLNGVVKNAPTPGLFSASAVQSAPTEEERLMLRGGFEYPPKSVYAVK